MMLLSDYSLKPYNTFGIDVKARLFAPFESTRELQQLLQHPDLKEENKLILGGGSNLLFTRDFDGLVLQNKIKGIEVLFEDAEYVFVKAGAGEVWHDFVLYTLSLNLGGIENLSLIPGTVGASPLQNIGAYGVELKDVFHELEALHIETGKIVLFDKESCRFGYRESIFKSELKGQFIVTHVTFRLSKKHRLNTSYGALKSTLEEMQVLQPTIQDVSEAVCHIRRSKLPDPAKIGNAGSFFKNPEISVSLFNELKEKYPSIPSFPVSDTLIKVPAGWLIEQCGWKGKVRGNYGVHKDQALVLVNFGGANGIEISNLAQEIIQSVTDKFNINLHPEVNII